MNCPNCRAEVASSDNFCEDCGARLSPAPEALPPLAALGPDAEAPPCGNCGAGPETIDAQGFCAQCGLQRHPPARDHLEFEDGRAIAAVSDRGVRHFRNEDSFALGCGNGYTAAVLCDGVSNSPRADEASAAAALVIRDALVAGVRDGTADGCGVMNAAVSGAHAVVCGLVGDHALPKEGLSNGDMPATTAVAALVPAEPAAAGSGREVTLGWLGDSRAYFIDRHGGAQLLTRDHSWINEVVDAGEMTRTAALRNRNAHTVTKTLGGAPGKDGQPDVPSTLRASLAEPGWLILCSDGLWNYAPEPAELAAWVGRLVPEGADALALCRALTSEALRLGGRDNVTIVAIAV